MSINNKFVQLSGTVFAEEVLAGSQTVGITILCGVDADGSTIIPVTVNSSGAILTQ